jgi:prevent-host-death family protein
MSVQLGVWPVQEAKARFSELLDTCLTDGPQTITRRGSETAVLIPIAQWRRWQSSEATSLKSLLLADTDRFDLELPPRGRLQRRPVEAW